MKRKIKLVTIIISVFVLCLSLAACSSKKSEEEKLVDALLGTDADDLAESIMDNLSDEDIEALSKIDESTDLSELDSVFGNLGESKYVEGWDSSILPDGFPSEPKDIYTEHTEFDPESKGPRFDQDKHPEWYIETYCDETGYQNILDAFLNAGFKGFIWLSEDYYEETGALYKDGYLVTAISRKETDTTSSKGYGNNLSLRIEFNEKTYDFPEEVTDLFPEISMGIPEFEEDAFYISYYDKDWNDVDNKDKAVYWTLYYTRNGVLEEEFRAYATALEKAGYKAEITNYSENEEENEYIYLSGSRGGYEEGFEKEGCYLTYYKDQHSVEMQFSNYYGYIVY